MKPEFNIYVVSDLHFGHGKIIVHANRPFSNQDEMDTKLIANWNRTVRPQDMVIVVGDFIWTGGSSIKIKDYLKQLNGRIILVLGNHDKKSYNFYMNAGIQFVCDRFVWEFNGKRILFIHDTGHVSDEERMKYPYVIHGHNHQNKPLVRKEGNTYFINVSVENIKYTPLNLITLLSRLVQGYFDKKD